MTDLFKTPKAPPIQAPAAMPTPDDANVSAARRRAEVATRTRTGRQSTILTDYGGGKLGG